MKHINKLFVLFVILGLYGPIQSQDRFLEPYFDEVEVTQDLTYGTNFTILYLSVPTIGMPVPEDLKYDFYQPAGDTMTERPLVILMKTGNFLPIQTNGTVYGTKRDSATTEIAMRLAKAGYVVASLDYRLGWNPLAPTQPDRALQLIQAAYRGLQDSRTAIRHFKHDYETNENSMRVDTSRITVWGMGTGGYISMVTNTMDDYEKIISTTHPAGKFIIPSGPFAGLPMVVEAVNGDIYGTSDGVIPADNPPLVAGDSLARANYEGYSSDFQLTVNGSGALGDISWLEAGQTPVIAYHVPTDPNAPYGDDLLRVPTTGELVVEVQGSHDIVAKSNDLGNNDVFDEIVTLYDAHPIFETITEAAMESSSKAAYSDLIDDYPGHDYQEGLLPLIRPEGQGDPWNWWEPSRWDTVGVPNTELNFDQLARASNPDMSPEKGRLYIDTIMWYFMPRAYVALDLSEITSTENLIKPEEVSLSIAPNPASEQVFLKTDTEHPMKEVLVYDLNGRLMTGYSRINASQFEVPRNNLPPGMYILKIGFEEGVTAKRILFH